MNLSHTRMGTLYIGIILYHLHENVNGSFKQKPIYEGNHHLLYAVEVNTLVDVPFRYGDIFVYPTISIMVLFIVC